MTCVITGHRPKGFPFDRNDENSDFYQYKKRLREEIRQLINQGYDHFISGMADGADIDFLEIVLDEKRDKSIFIEAALPCPYSSKTENKKTQILRLCDNVKVISDHYFSGCMQKRNRYLVDNCDVLIAVWNGEEIGGTWNTIEYAKRKGKRIRFILL